MRAAGATTALAAALLAAAWPSAAPLFADPAMPKGFVVEHVDDTGLTWRETGTLPMPLDEALAALKAALKAQGYAMRHDITGDAFGDRHLFLFLKSGEEATVMAWPDGKGRTGLAWGVSTNSVAGPTSAPTTHDLKGTNQ